MGDRLSRSVWRRLELWFWALAAPVACNQGGGAKYGPGPMPDCDPFTSRVASVEVTPSPVHPDDALVVTATFSLAAGQRVDGASYHLDDLPGGTSHMRDDGVAPDVVPDDGTFTGTSTAPAAGVHTVTVDAILVKEGSTDPCAASASVDLDVTE